MTCIAPLHVKAFIAIQEVPSVSQTFHECENDDFVDTVWCAEVLLTNLFLVEHSIPLLAADHGATPFGEVFPNSKLAQSLHSARTKTTALIQHQVLLKKLLGKLFLEQWKFFQ